MARTMRRIAAIIGVVSLFAVGPTAKAEDESGYAKNGVYVGGMLSYVTVGEDFNGRDMLVDPNQALLLPDIHGAGGWGAIVGLRHGRFSAEVNYVTTRHDWTMHGDVSPMPSSGDGHLQSLNLDFKVHFGVDNPVQPYVLFGPSASYLRLNGASVDGSGNVGHSEFYGLGGKIGAGVAVYIGPRVCLSGGVYYNQIFYSDYEGIGGSGTLEGGDEDDFDDDRIIGGGFGFVLSLTFTF